MLHGILAVGSLLVIGILDYMTGPRVAVLLFYVMPVCVLAWYAGTRPGVLLAVASALVWYQAQALDPNPQYEGWLLVWNAFIACSVMVISAVLSATVSQRTVELAHANAILKAEVAERTAAQAKLKLLNETLEQRVAERSAAAEARARELSRSDFALRRQTGILQSILKSIGDAVVVADAESHIVLFNPAAERLLSLSASELGAELVQGVDPQTGEEAPPPAWVWPLASAVDGKTVDGHEVFVREDAGADPAWLSATSRPLVDDSGKPQGGVAVFRDVTPHKLLEKQIIEISDREQCRLGQELHDGLCQHLVSTAFAAGLLRDNMAARKLSEAVRVDVICDMINQCISQSRQLARGLYPVRLEIDGLASALEELAQRTRTLHNIDCVFNSEGPALIADPVAGFNLFRIAQESVNNSVKHGKCDHVTISLDAVEDEVTLAIVDNGVGVPIPGPNSEGMGLHIMNYRAQMIGATLDIRRGINGGTMITCSYRNENRPKESNSARSGDSKEDIPR